MHFRLSRTDFTHAVRLQGRGRYRFFVLLLVLLLLSFFGVQLLTIALGRQQTLAWAPLIEVLLWIIPIVVVSQWLADWLMGKHYDEEVELMGEVTVELVADELVYSTGSSTARIPRDKVRAVIGDARVVLLVLGRSGGHIIPRAALEQEPEIRAWLGLAPAGAP